MKTLTLVVDERELSTIRAALLLLQEQVDALPEDLAEMIAEHGTPMTASEIEYLSLHLDEMASPIRDYAARESSGITRVAAVEGPPAAAIQGSI
jgi:hypothetical protein